MTRSHRRLTALIAAAPFLLVSLASTRRAAAAEAELDPLLRILVRKGVLTEAEAREVEREAAAEQQEGPVRLFDPAWEQPALLAPGDAVRFEPISLDEYESIRESVAAGRYTGPSAEIHA